MDPITNIKQGNGREKRRWAEALYNKWKPLLGNGPLVDESLIQRLDDEIVAVASVKGFLPHANYLESLKPSGRRYVWRTRFIATSETIL